MDKSGFTLRPAFLLLLTCGAVFAADSPIAGPFHCAAEPGRDRTPPAPNEGALRRADLLYAQAEESLKRKDLAASQRLYSGALGEYEKAFSSDIFPAGHWKLALVMQQLGYVAGLQAKPANELSWYERAVAMHRRLVQRDGKTNWKAFATVLRNLGIALKEADKLIDAGKCLTEALALAKQKYPQQDYRAREQLIASCLHDLGLLQVRLRHYQQAIEAHCQSLELKRKLYPRAEYPRGHREIVLALWALGTAYAKQRDWERAELFHLEACDMQERLRAPTGADEDTEQRETWRARLYANLGYIFLVRGRSELAVYQYQRHLKCRQEYYAASDSPAGRAEIARALDLVAKALRDAAPHDEVACCEEKALEMRRGRCAPGQPANPCTRPLEAGEARENGPSADFGDQERRREGSLLYDAGLQLYRSKRFADAAIFFQRALHVRDEAYPSTSHPRGHEELAASLVGLGDALRRCGRSGEAKAHIERALEIRRAIRPPGQHPDVGWCLGNLAEICRARSEYNGAKHYFEQTLNEYRCLYAPARHPGGHESIAWALNGLGIVYESQGDLVRAREFYQQGVDMRRRLLKNDAEPTIREHLAVGLNNLGVVLERLGDTKGAEECFREARSMPSGSEDYDRRQMLRSRALAEKTLEKFRGAKAVEHCARAFEMAKKAYPQERFPSGHVEIAKSRGYLGVARMIAGKPQDARNDLEAALEMLNAAPGHEDPGIQRDRLSLLKVLSSVLLVQGESARARQCEEEAKALEQQLAEARPGQPASGRVGHPTHPKGPANGSGPDPAEQVLLDRLQAVRGKYPAEKYPDGHFAVRTALESLGTFYEKRDVPAKAEAALAEALAMQEKLYSTSKSPLDAYFLATSRNGFARFLARRNRAQEARTCYEELLVLSEKADLVDQPLAAPVIAAALTGMVQLGPAPGGLDRATAYCRRLIASPDKLRQQGMWKSLVLNHVGEVLLDAARYQDAFTFLEHATRRQHAALDEFSLAASEAETLNFVEFSQKSLANYLGAWRHLNVPADQVYATVWQRQGRLQELLAERQQALVKIDDAEARRLFGEYRETRRALATLLGNLWQADFPQSAAEMEQAETLSRKKEEIERRFAADFPDVSGVLARAIRSHHELREALPQGAVFVDFVEYPALGRDPGGKSPGLVRRVPSYAAFVLGQGAGVTFVDLAEAKRIDAAVLAWRKAIAEGGEGRPAGEVRDLVWTPIARRLAATTRIVYLRPEGSLTALPWGAIPADSPSGVLLEQFAFATVPSGQFLLEHLAGKQRKGQEKKKFLAIGNVDYDAKLKGTKDSLPGVSAGGAADGRQRAAWPGLPGTRQEIDAIAAVLGEKDATGVQLSLYSGAEASVTRVLRDLPEARWAHFSTHGFFATPPAHASPPGTEVWPPGGLALFRGERTDVVARNPLVLSGLVLAGANCVGGGKAVLSAEALAAMPLSGLDLVVLSTCESGLGDVARSEGVFGLQRAFHLGGAKNVVATLWKLEDMATAALIKVFYYKFWVEQRPAVDALREAQLTIYRNPTKVGELANQRGTEWKQTLRGLALLKPERIAGKGHAGAGSSASPTRWWAGFVLSGKGQ